MKPTILTCAVVGSGPMRKDNPAIPYTPAEIAAATVEAAKAGASVAHIHVRDPETGAASMELKHYRETVERIRNSGVDIILNLTTGPGARFEPREDDPTMPGPRTNLTSPEKRCEHVVELKPEMCTLDLDTMLSRNAVTINLPKHVARIAELVQAVGVKPEIEVFNPGDIVLAHDLIKEGVLKGPLLFQMVTGVKYGVPSEATMIEAMRKMLPNDSEWAAFGIGRMQYPVMAQSFLLGGHARVGFEDNIYLEKGKLASGNGALVETAVRIISDLGGAVATPNEARALLGLKNKG
jgi:uncharacterized protein (DUF849 family)